MVPYRPRRIACTLASYSAPNVDRDGDSNTDIRARPCARRVTNRRTAERVSAAPGIAGSDWRRSK
jgi:hypothetical protein